MACARRNGGRGRAGRRATCNQCDGGACPAASNALAQEFYGTETEPCTMRSCTDFYGTTQRSSSRRNPFWPSFAHPRWLSCRELYNCRKR